MIKMIAFIVKNVTFVFHIKCNNNIYIDYKYLSGNSDPSFCCKCNSHLFPFVTLNDKVLITLN